MKPFFCSFILLFFCNAIAIGQQTAVIKEILPFGNNPQAGKYYNIRGMKMYCEVYGKGQPLLMIHGNNGSIENFKQQIPYFSQHYKVIIADSRAQGKSIDKGDSLSYEMMADDYAALLDAMHLDSANVIGWSDGGINGLLLAMRRPDLVRRLAVTGPNLWPDTTAIHPVVVQQIRDWAKDAKAAADKNRLKLMQLMLDQPNIPLQTLHVIKCPVLVIGGDHDVIREEHTMQIYQHIPQAYLWILPNSGHSTLITYKEDFNKIVANFLKNPYRVIEGEGRFN
ncbi:MAG TPA: alpha/beta hydrolase [Chitinophaga sp.]|uniref:alpha/beta fold hydrolase n=1 Tax=Chitinophaga sp. TaxID=1869181 RepID=UPI002B749B34|nr:alpha/beta hydrolase [Chitinophaga sp.]HVI47982.1 alpha/beta hydrolase [Chitinophaga sp.]